MKHQITLVGGQSLPILLGIKEYSPEKVHFLYSKESKKRINSIKVMVPTIKSSEYLVDAFDFENIKSICTKILETLALEDEVVFNLTGGTKIMVLAVQAIILEKKLNGFYINQNNTILTIPQYSKHRIKTTLSASDFFALSGHSNFKAQSIGDFTKEDIKAANEIDTFRSNKKYNKVTKYLRDKYPNDTIPLVGDEVIDKKLKLNCIWSNGNVEIISSDKCIFKSSSPKIRNLFFFGGWWELTIANTLNQKIKPFEMLINVQLPFINDKSSSKTEIDILINANNKLIFIECKSGRVKLEDINKMRTIKETYGGLVSKSVLVTKYPLNSNIKERCNELEIEIYTGMNGNFNNLIQVINKLDKNTSL